jgi:hypothetical protein
MLPFIVFGLVGAVVAIIFVFIAVPWLGFTSVGIAAGSWGASMMSWLAPTQAGGIIALLQSVGAAGFSLVQFIFVGIFGSIIGLITYTIQWFISLFFG